MSQIKQQEFSERIVSRLSDSSNERLKELRDEDFHEFFEVFWQELARSLFEGHRVIFDGWVSFFTNPVKRKCYDAPTADSLAGVTPRPQSWSFKRRVRFKPLSEFRRTAEVPLTEAAYLAAKKSKDKRKK